MSCLRLKLDLSGPAPADLADLFPHPVDAVRLEIGFGAVSISCLNSSATPETGFIAWSPSSHGDGPESWNTKAQYAGWTRNNVRSP